MSQITLVRHGQAQTHARDEATYDALSPLGTQQSQWLGAHLIGTGTVFSSCHVGTLTRHAQTLDAMGNGWAAGAVADARLNELEYFTLSRLFEVQHDAPVPADREGFVHHLPAMFTAWAEGRIDGAPETFEAFETRVRAALDDIVALGHPALIVTSGGVIGMAMRLSLGLDLQAMSQMCLSIANTSVHGMFPLGGRLTPTLFNALPHLDTPDRRHALTHL